MKSNINWELVLKYLEKDCSQSEEQKIDDWIKSDLKNEKIFNQIKTIWNTTEVQIPKPDIEQAWSVIKEKSGIDKQIDTGINHQFESIKKQNQVLQWFVGSRLLKAAAIFLIIFLSSYLLFQHTSSVSMEMKEIIVNKSEIKNIILADGTQITLDAGSKFRYPIEFKSDKREVFLNGECYFKVKSNPEKPFIIHANDAEITVLGTVFNVRSWAMSKKTTVAVNEGKVSLRPESINDPDASVIISSSQMSELRENEYPIEPKDIDINNHLSWLNREMYMKNVPLRDVLDQLERWHSVDIILSDESYASNLVTVFIQNKPIEDILDVIALMNNFKYEYVGNKVTFSSEKEIERNN